MSTLPGLASKGEKEKSKYQSLDINKLYRVSLGESLEKQQQKSTLSQKHGMQSLGKVPSTRRPPANLPSLKSEHSGTDTAVSLVPSNGSGWGKQDTSVSTPTTPTVQQATNAIANAPLAPPSGTPQMSAHQAAIALPVTTTIQPANKPLQLQQQHQHPHPPHPTTVTPAANLDKSWSSVMIGVGNDPNAAHPPPYQSPQFQHEFPSLSSGDGAPPRTATDIQYAPGLSLRPQTEGSWLQGGGARAPDAATANSAQPGGQPQLSVPGGQGQPLPPQVRGFVPPFMFRGSNFPTNGHAGPTATAPTQQSLPQRRDPRLRDDLAHRPIIKEEELHGMDNLTGDMGWAINDDIDYNQKLAFSDDETRAADKESRKAARILKDGDKTDIHPQDADHKQWARNQARSRHEDDEFSAQRRRQQQEIAHAVERAKQRKEEEEKKFLETKQAAAKKLQALDERIGKSKRDKDNDETSGTINPASVPPQTIAPVPILLPEWEREKEIVRPKSTPSSQHQHHDIDIDIKTKSDFKHLTQIEGRATFNRKESRSSEKEQPGGAQQPSHSFSKQFQNDLPPRFQKQQQLNAYSTQQQQQPFSYENRWPTGNRTSPSSRKRDDDKDIDERYRRQDDNYRHNRYGETGRKSSDSRYEDYKEREYDIKPKEDEKVRRDRHDSVGVSRQNSEEWHSDKRGIVADKYDRPQRPDSRDSRTSRESRHSGDSTRHSEPREYTSWAEEPLEEKKKEHRLVVPGPITKEKIEADDLRNEKRNLTQLKRGSIPDKKDKSGEHDEDSWSLKRKDGIDEPKAWADSIPPAVEKAAELLKAREEKLEEEEKKEKFDKDDKKMHSARGRSDSQGSRNQGWSGNGQVYRSSWSSNKKNAPPPPRNARVPRPLSAKGADMTESEGSADDAAAAENGQKPIKKMEKDEKNKEAKSGGDKMPLDKSKMEKNHFIPRGEPSRHGRGGGGGGGSSGSFRGGRGGSKRIDTYGPPVKSPFSNCDDRKDDFDDDKGRRDYKFDDKSRKKPDPRKPRSKDGDVSDNSDADGRKSKNPMRSTSSSTQNRRGAGGAPTRQPPISDKRGFGGPRIDMPHRQNSAGNLPMRSTSAKDIRDIKDKETNALSAAIADITLKETDMADGGEIVDDGFQEVKNKKTERKIEKPIIIKEFKDDKPKLVAKPEKDLKKPERNERIVPKPINQISQQQQQQIANIPSLMATPINPPPNMAQLQANKGQFERNRQNKTLPPRFVKAREHNRMQKAQMQQSMCDDINKVNPSMYGLKEVVSPPLAASNAWDKPLPAQMRTVDQEMVSVGMEACKSLEATLHHPTTDDKAVLDSSKPLNTIIFENTNYKTVPGGRNARPDKPRCKIEDGMDNLTGFNKPIGDMLVKDKADQLQMQLFHKEDSADMKLDFLESEITQITDDKSSKMSMPRSNIATSNNILTADALNMKIQSVKKVWESNIPNVMEHSNDDSFTSSFADPNSMDPNTVFSKGSEVPDDNHDVYNTSPNANASNSTTNVCKVKPTQQIAGAGGQTLLAGTHQPHSNNLVGPTLMGHTLSSPPPIQPVIGGLGQPPQQYTSSQHISYQAGLGSNQFGGIPAPSPPTVLNYSAQQYQQTAGLYAPFQLEQSQVMNNQGRSYSYGLGQTGSSPYSHSQSMYLQTGQPQHAPPAAQPDLYQNMNNFRLPNTGPFGQNQQLNNPTTVLISSTSNSLMSPSVKSTNQQPISAIGTKAGGVGQAYQQQSQQGQQVYIPYDPAITANYMQRGPGGPVQNNIVPGLQPSGSSFYSGSTGGQTGYFQGPTSSNLQSQMPQHQSGFGLQQSVFATHNQSHTQSYGSPYLSGPMQMAAAAAVSHYRSANMQNNQYMKSQLGDQGRQQLKSPGSQQEVLSSVFNSGPQISSPKSRQQMKQPPPQPSPTAQHKYLYGGMSNQQSGQTRYPTPIQRPAGNYQSPSQLNMQNTAPNQKPHRMNNSNNRTSGGRQYYGGPQGGNMNTQADKSEESKLSDAVNSSNASSGGGAIKVSNTSVNPTDKTDAKEENCAKD